MTVGWICGPDRPGWPEHVRAALKPDIAGLAEPDRLFATRQRSIDPDQSVVPAVLTAGFALAAVALASRAWSTDLPVESPRAGSRPSRTTRSVLWRQGRGPGDDGPAGSEPDAVLPLGPKHGRSARKKAAGASR